jgi:hypothetical protein
MGRIGRLGDGIKKNPKSQSRAKRSEGINPKQIPNPNIKIQKIRACFEFRLPTEASAQAGISCLEFKIHHNLFGYAISRDV